MKTIIYGADWCGDSLRTKNVLEANNIEHDFFDVDDEQLGKRYSETVIEMNNGKRIIPTLVINGKQYTNPTLHTLSKIFGDKILETKRIDSDTCDMEDLFI